MHRLGSKFLRAGKTNLNSADIQQVNDTLDKFWVASNLLVIQLEQYTPIDHCTKTN